MYAICMNAFDRHKKNMTAQCEDCNDVFDTLSAATMHRDEKGHKLKITEFWVTGR
ncbi:MAG TPA: hypothetical protein VI033_03980 [Candidatus Nitrosopolaris sp.]|jgi:hypothetical protein